MPKGFHCGRVQTRAYTGEYHRLSANVFSKLIESSLGNYKFEHDHLSEEHCRFKLIKSSKWERIAVFNILGHKYPIPLQQDNRSASNKVYLICPHCEQQRQHIYAVRNGYSCRKCLGLHYASQSERPMDRLARRIRKLRSALWGYDWPDKNNLIETCRWWPKPKGMSHNKFEKERMKIINIENEYWALSEIQLRNMFGNDFGHLLDGTY